MSDRITGVIVVILSIAFFASSTQLAAPFFADPLGPKAFPMMIAAVASIAGIVMIIKPDSEPAWPKLAVFGRLLFALLTLVFYALTLKPLGFLLPTALVAGAISYQIKPRGSAAVIIGLCLSIGLFVIFRYALGLSLFAFPRWLMN